MALAEIAKRKKQKGSVTHHTHTAPPPPRSGSFLHIPPRSVFFRRQPRGGGRDFRPSEFAQARGARLETYVDGEEPGG